MSAKTERSYMSADRMTRVQADEEANRRWGKYAIVAVACRGTGYRYIVADAHGVRGTSNESWEQAFHDADQQRVVNHQDGDIHNNAPGNLEIVP